ncbi:MULTISPECIES: pirin family protein [Pseudomonas]|jgi:redox-sensitive bicupin YhaK (pirin superfamily)|uniref:Redox-sensitive bicupin YhaK, pirin superfamily n=3 Tax=Pseudomonas TaxID=286 RepID=A0A1H0UPU1_PSERE|nr:MULTISPECIES: pirin family protein [Pseudomonas]OLU05893.1 hypothetical protein BVK86_00610 [Pseudomonas reinekei]SDP68171.1 Redox-sensitive bicupin YhaK, pirin superfamily [Pseudomonas reinekei]SDQ93576.1 Redox-sensitive bicupin YhaK, pirin superfamily [Pseudomonas moorei]
MNLTALRNTGHTRQISHRNSGSSHGPIVRLMSPSDFGQLLKPFVFLDLFDAPSSFLGQMPVHPHSGIATVTVITEGNMHFDDPDAGSGTIGYGGVEWLRAGAGVWHGKELSSGTSARVQGFQLWLALPAELESAPVDSQYLEASATPQVGPARVIVGRYEGVQSPIRAPAGVNYLLVTIPAGESWTYTPPKGHRTLWLCVSRGAVHTPDKIESGEMVVFQPGHQALTLEAGNRDAVFVLGSAFPHPYDLKLGYYSVHTNDEALRAGEAKIAEIANRMRQQKTARQASASIPVFK